MPDTPLLPVFESRPASERRSPSTGLPILSVEPLNAAERDALRKLARALRLVADGIDEAIDRGRVAHGLDACTQVDNVAIASREVTAFLGSRR